mmetsp:Transcript_40980/g.89280  ORF Transcript_40980/g.89280 Transcript_40980/m.89280 type:complete len:341 (+) Transcript_40980:293-1315(+)
MQQSLATGEGPWCPSSQPVPEHDILLLWVVRLPGPLHFSCVGVARSGERRPAFMPSFAHLCRSPRRVVLTQHKLQLPSMERFLVVKTVELVLVHLSRVADRQTLADQSGAGAEPEIRGDDIPHPLVSVAGSAGVTGQLTVLLVDFHDLSRLPQQVLLTIPLYRLAGQGRGPGELPGDSFHNLILASGHIGPVAARRRYLRGLRGVRRKPIFLPVAPHNHCEVVRHPSSQLIQGWPLHKFAIQHDCWEDPSFVGFRPQEQAGARHGGGARRGVVLRDGLGVDPPPWSGRRVEAELPSVLHFLQLLHTHPLQGLQCARYPHLLGKLLAELRGLIRGDGKTGG